MASTDQEKGFSGLINLVSNIDIIEEPKKTKHQSTTSTSNQSSQTQHSTSSAGTTTRSPQSQHKTVHADSKSEKISAPQHISKVNSTNNVSSTGILWAIFVFFLFIIFLINITDDDSSSPRTLTSINHANQISTTNKETGVFYEKPPIIMADRPLLASEIRWCIKTDIRIKAMQNIINTTGIDEFDHIIKDYNRRCKNQKYTYSSQVQAQREVKPYEQQIIEEATREAKRILASQASNLSTKKTVKKKTITKKPLVTLTEEAQNLLADLGYNPGPLDADYGPKTIAAVKAFQRASGLKVDGWIDENLLIKLRAAKAKQTPVKKNICGKGYVSTPEGGCKSDF